MGAVLALALAASACGSSSDDKPSTSSAKVDTAAQALLPKDLRSGGTLTVGAEIGGPPGQYFEEDGSTITGFGYDLGQGVADKLGLKLKWQNLSFDGLIPGLSSKKIDLIISSMSDTAERQKVLSFVDYFAESTGIMVKAGNPKGISAIEDLCGLKLAIKPGTGGAALADETSKGCEDAGKPAIKILPYPNNAAIDLQLKSGGVDATLDDASGLAYVAKTFGGGKVFEVVKTTEKYQAGPLGIGVRKDDEALAKAIQAALNSMHKDGSYTKILDKFGVNDGALDPATINATS